MASSSTNLPIENGIYGCIVTASSTMTEQSAQINSGISQIICISGIPVSQSDSEGALGYYISDTVSLYYLNYSIV
jgi:hypothetical protein